MDYSVQVVISSLLPCVQSPIQYWDPLVIREPVASGYGTLVVWELDRCDAEQQQWLLTWLSTRPEPAQVISTASSHLFARVAYGAFLDALYYRLNTVRVELTNPTELRPTR